MHGPKLRGECCEIAPCFEPLAPCGTAKGALLVASPPLPTSVRTAGLTIQRPLAASLLCLGPRRIAGLRPSASPGDLILSPTMGRTPEPGVRTVTLFATH